MLLQMPDTNKFIERKVIQRAGYQVVRFKGHYRQVMGGIRTPLRISRIKQGKC